MLFSKRICRYGFRQISYRAYLGTKRVGDVFIDECYDFNNNVIITTDEKYKRPAEVDLLIGDSTKAREQLGWKPKHDIHSLIDDMLKWDLKRAGL